MGRLEKALERMKRQDLQSKTQVRTPPTLAPEEPSISQPLATEPTISQAPAAETRVRQTTTGGPAIAEFTLDPALLQANRIINPSSDPAIVTAYKMLRTRVLQRMRANGWRSLAVTSATPGDGKTMTAINLAISLAGDVNHNVCLVDLDLRHSSVSRYLGIQAEKGTSDCLRRGVPVSEALVRPDIDRLVILPNAQIETHSSELLSSPEMHEMAQRWVLEDPGRIIIYDMPPLLSACRDGKKNQTH